MGLEYLKRRRLHNLPGQPGPGLRHPQREEVLPPVQLELPLLQLVPMYSDKPLVCTFAFSTHRLPLPYSLHRVESSHLNDQMFKLWGAEDRSSLAADLVCAPFTDTLQALHGQGVHPFLTLPGSSLSLFHKYQDTQLSQIPVKCWHFLDEKLRHEKN